MSNNVAPDSWESQADTVTSTDNSPERDTDVTTKFSTLNVNAVEFVPSFCMNVGNVEQQERSSPVASLDSATNSPKHDVPVVNGKFCPLFSSFCI